MESQTGRARFKNKQQINENKHRGVEEERREAASDAAVEVGKRKERSRW